MGQFWYVSVIPALPLLLVHLVGVIVAVILLVRHRSTPAILATIGFVVLLVWHLSTFGTEPMARMLIEAGVRPAGVAITTVGCCCSVLNVIAVVCLIIAIWQAVTGATGRDEDKETEEIEEEAEEGDDEGRASANTLVDLKLQ